MNNSDLVFAFYVPYECQKKVAASPHVLQVWGELIRPVEERSTS